VSVEVKAMKIRDEIFLLTAEELSVSRAAKRAFVTPQCVSDHLKRLEEEYGILLFERKPGLNLTEAGKVMQQTLRNIKIMEESMQSSLRSMVKGEIGNFTLGISTSRASIIIPPVLNEYYKIYPNVNISFCVEDTPILEKRLLRGEIDMFIGVNTSYYPDIELINLATDEIRLIISSELLHRYFNDEEILNMETGVDMTSFIDIPFTLSFKTGKVNHVIEEYLNYYNLKLNVIYNISDSETQILLCAEGLCASLCPKMLLSTAYRYNLIDENKNKLYILPIKNLDRFLHVDLACHKNVARPIFVQRFIEILQNEVTAIAKNYT
jgi:DNA-binding transcriptional LysR family regulator